MSVQEAASATDVLPDLYAFHRSTRNSASPSGTLAYEFATHFLSLAKGFHVTLRTPPTGALRPVIPNNASPLRLTAAAGTELAGACYGGTVIPRGYLPPDFIPPHRVLHSEKRPHSRGVAGSGLPPLPKIPTAASRRSLGRVSVPVWLIILSDQLPIVALVGHYPTSQLIGRIPLLLRQLARRGQLSSYDLNHKSVCGITPTIAGLSPQKRTGQIRVPHPSAMLLNTRKYRSHSTCMC